MSTHSFIAKKVGADQYKSIYCHFDGYPSHVGLLLCKYYNTEEKLDELLALGDLGSLGSDLKSRGVEDIGNRTHAFGRDCGETDCEAQIRSLHEMAYDVIDYIYILDENEKWQYCKARYIQEGFSDLKELLMQRLPDEFDEPANTPYDIS